MKNAKIPYKITSLSLMALCAALVFAAATRERQRADAPDLARLACSPDNRGPASGGPGPQSRAARPALAYPPYAPVAMTARAGHTGLVVYNNTSGLAMIDPVRHVISPVLLNEYDYAIDPETKSPIGGPLGCEQYGRYDLAMTSDGRQALISNIADQKVFFVDLGSGTPVVTGQVKIDFYPEDIAIDPGNQWALVSGVYMNDKIAVLNIPARAWVPAGYDGTTGEPYSFHFSGRAQAVAVAADGRTVIAVDYPSRCLHAFLFDPASGGLAYSESSETLWKQGAGPSSPFPVAYYPINVAISPDGRTVIAINTNRSTEPGNPNPHAIFEGCNTAVFTIDAPGHLTRRSDLILPFQVGGGQSLAFSANGRRAYLHALFCEDPVVGPLYAEIQILAVDGPGLLRHVGSMRSPTLRDTNQFFGVDVLAVTPDGNFLYATNPGSNHATPVIDVYDLRSQRHVKQIGTPTMYADPERDYPDPPDPPMPGVATDWIAEVIPIGIAFPATRPNRPPVAVVTADRSELFLDVPETAAFDGSGSHDPEGSPLTYRWSLVSSPAGAEAALTANGAAATLAPDPNVTGTYQVGLVVNDGRLDSAMATAMVAAKFYPVLPPAAPTLQRLENDFIFYKEYVNRLAWSANPGNKAAIAAIKVYRKPKQAGDSGYTLLVSLPAAAVQYDDKGLAAGQLFTYRIASVNSRGVESDPVVVGN